MTVSAVFRPSPSDPLSGALHKLAASLRRQVLHHLERRRRRREDAERAAMTAWIDDVHAMQRGLGHDLASARQARWARGEGRPGRLAV